MAEYIERSAGVSILRAKANMAVLMDAAPYFEKAAQMLEKLPAADVAPVVHGQWIEKSAPARKIYFECSNCGAKENKHTAIKGYYCWRCGAKMDGRRC